MHDFSNGFSNPGSISRSLIMLRVSGTTIAGAMH